MRGLRSKGQKLLRAVIGVLMLVATPIAQAQVATSFTDIGLPSSGAWSSSPAGVNNLGQVSVNVGGSLNGFLWDRSTGWHDIGGLGVWVFSEGINDNGQVVAINLASDFSHNDGLIWDATRGWRVMGGFVYNGGPAGVFPRAINNRGQVVGGSWSGSFIWDETNGPTYLNQNWWPRDINDAGQVVGTDYGSYQAFLWDSTHGTTFIGDLGGGYSEAYAINENGQVVGSAYVPGKGWHAFFWDPKSGMKDLGAFGGYTDFDFGGYTEWSGAFAINDLGQVVGQSSKADGTYVAFIWDAVNGMRELFSTSWVRPTDINNLGHVVGEYYSSTGHTRAFFATVPLPPPILQGQTQALIAAITALVDSGVLTPSEASELNTSLDAAIKSLDKGNTGAAKNQLNAAVNKIEALVRSGRLSASRGKTLTDAINAIIASI